MSELFPNKRTKTVCTIGPASKSKGTILELIDRGMDVARMNFSHSTHEYHKEVYETLREAESESGRPLGILCDLQGPKIRTSKLEKNEIHLEDGATIYINNQSEFLGNEKEIGCTYENILKDILPGQKLLIDDGKLVLSVVEKTSSKALLKVEVGGILKNNKGINLPGTSISSPAMSDKDLSDLEFALSLGVDFVALSFVRKKEDLLMAKSYMKNSFAGLIAKIERPEAIVNIKEILENCDGIMIARGDLGVELDTEKVPLLQKELISLANHSGKPVITATQMLESMIENPRPTRAEASDVANAVLDGTDAVMLSGESASGRFPRESVETMSKIITKSESSSNYFVHRLNELKSAEERERTALGNAAEQIASSISAKAIINFTRSGYSALMASMFRPKMPIYSFTPFLMTSRKMKLYWGVTPYIMPMMDKFSDMISFMGKTLKAEGKLQVGDTVVILSGAPGSVAQSVDFIQVYKIP